MILLGPCICQGCGEEVVLLADHRLLGWLHPNGGFACVERWCKRCEEYWPLDDTHWGPRDGHPRRECRTCRRVYNRLAYEKQREPLLV
jgi:hypothetical protein